MTNPSLTYPMITRGPGDALCRVADEAVAMELAEELFSACYRASMWFRTHSNTGPGLARIVITDADCGWELSWPRFVTDATHAFYIRQHIAEWAAHRGLDGATVTFRTAKPEHVANTGGQV